MKAALLGELEELVAFRRSHSSQQCHRAVLPLRGDTAKADDANAEKVAMKATFWGVRGSMPTPGASTLSHGGNSPCVEVETGDGQLLILDCGTGARALGQALMAAERKPRQGHLLITHTHWDHIQGFPFFGPIYVPGNTFTIYGARVPSRSLEAVFSGQLDNTYFPVSLRQPAANLQFKELVEEEFHIGSTKVRTLSLNHTALTLGYRLEHGGRSLAYITDHEPYSRHFPKWGVSGTGLHLPDAAPLSWNRQVFVHEEDQHLVDFVQGVDLLIQDAQYLETEYASHVGWGHGSIDYALSVAVAGGVKQLVLFHHDPDHDDALLSAIGQECQTAVAGIAPALRVTCAAERWSVVLEEEPRREQRDKPKVLVAEDDMDVAAVLAYILREEGYDFIMVDNGQEAIEKTLSEHPDIVLLDIMLPVVDGYGVSQALRANPATRKTPIIMLTGRSDASDTQRGFQAGADDYMIKPFAPSQVRARVRAWLLRSGHLKES